MTLSYHHHIIGLDHANRLPGLYAFKQSVLYICQHFDAGDIRLSFAIVGTVLQKELFQAKLPLRKITSKKRDIDVDRLEVSWIRVRFEFFLQLFQNY